MIKKKKNDNIAQPYFSVLKKAALLQYKEVLTLGPVINMNKSRPANAI